MAFAEVMSNLVLEDNPSNNQFTSVSEVFNIFTMDADVHVPYAYSLVWYRVVNLKDINVAHMTHTRTHAHTHTHTHTMAESILNYKGNARTRQ